LLEVLRFGGEGGCAGEGHFGLRWLLLAVGVGAGGV
jgi:hypothetical protein